MTSNRSVTIYGLIDPRNSEIRYIGQTVGTLEWRLRGHLAACTRRHWRGVGTWVRGLKESGLAPEIFEIERHDCAFDADDAERFWIEYFRFIGAALLNRAIGGFISRGWTVSAEDRAKMTAERRGRPNHANRGKKRTPEQCAKISAALKAVWKVRPHSQLGRIKSPEEIEKIRASRRGRPHVLSERGRQSVSDKAKERWTDPEWRARFTAMMSGANNPRYGKRPPDHQIEAVRRGHRRGFKHTEETKQKMRAAALLRPPAPKGRKLTAEHKLKLAAAARLREQRKRDIANANLSEQLQITRSQAP